MTVHQLMRGWLPFMFCYRLVFKLTGNMSKSAASVAYREIA
ncbi:hypothetical protein U5A82_15655 [Sphingobium sp. CR2-8]|nr:hypothetical protein [Sphingobium sp. CR2-8]MEC3911852.1 hypothetical protein [Sphingobium sp. CR2-8]